MHALVLTANVCLGLNCKQTVIPDSFLDTVKHTIPMKRGGEPQEIADVVAFLLSEEASYCTGANIRVAGGKRMGCTQ